MAMIQRLRDKFPDTELEFKDGHYRKIYDSESDILDTVKVTAPDGRSATYNADCGQRNRPKPKRIEETFAFLIGRFLDEGGKT